MTSPEHIFRPPEFFAPDTGSGGGLVDPTESEEFQTPIHVRIGEPFTPFERDKLPDIPSHQFVLEKPFVVEGIGMGHVRLAELVTVTDSAPLSSEVHTKPVKHYYDPFGTPCVVCNVSPDFDLERTWRAPLALEDIRLALDQPKTDVEPPVVLIEFRGTPYRYWAVDTLVRRYRQSLLDAERKWSYLQRTTFDKDHALYFWWFSEQHGIHQNLAVSRDSEELGRMQLTLLTKDRLPFHEKSLLPPRPSMSVLGPTPIAKHR